MWEKRTVRSRILPLHFPFLPKICIVFYLATVILIACPTETAAEFYIFLEITLSVLHASWITC